MTFGDHCMAGVLFVPRGTIFAEWEGLGAVCCICFIFLGLGLRVIQGFCALLQRMGILKSGAAKQIPGKERKKGKSKIRAGSCGIPPLPQRARQGWGTRRVIQGFCAL